MNFDGDDPKSVVQFVWRELPRHKHCALGTTDDTGKPWVVCVNLSFDAELNIFWKSLKNTEHSRHIAQRPDVSICIFSADNGIGDYGLYTEATAHEAIDENEITHIIKHRYANKEKPSVSDFTGNSQTRLYVAQVTAAWINDDRHIKTPIDLGVLRQIGGTP